MHASVRAAWHQFSEPFEGRVPHMYCDVLGLVTCGVGNLIDPIEAALVLPWRRADGTLASAAEVRMEWNNVKSQKEYLRKRHYKFAGQLTGLRLSDEDIDALVQRKLQSNDLVLARAFPGWDGWPADAQLGASSMAWAMGPGFPSTFKNFTRYANGGDWIAASVACKIATVAKRKRADGTIEEIPNPGTIPRNQANALCFRNAATVIEHALARDVLWWPRQACAEPETLPAPPIVVKPLPLEVDWDELRTARDATIKDGNG